MKSNFRKILGVSMSVAMLTSMLVTAAPAMALSSATVTGGNYNVGQNTTWDIRFSVATAISGDNSSVGGNITITFPSGFTVPQSVANVTGVTVAAGPGWISSSIFGNANITQGFTVNSTASSRKVVIKFLPDEVIGADAQVRILLPALVVNPTTTGNYTLKVSTSNETSTVDSAGFSIVIPTLQALPGLVSARNSAGDLLYQAYVADISAALATAGVSPNGRIELGAGTYNATNNIPSTSVNITLVGTGAPGTVILTAPTGTVPLTVVGIGAVIDNLTINGAADGTANLVDLSTNCTIKNTTLNGGVNQLNISQTSATLRAYNVDNVTFGVTGNVSVGINATSSTNETTNNASGIQVIVNRSTFNVDAGGTGIATMGNLTLNNSTFTGSSTSPKGVTSSNGTATITNNTFTGLNQALVVSGNTTGTGNSTYTPWATVTATGNTITGNGATSGTGTTGTVSCSGGVLVLTNNTIKDIGLYVSAISVSGGNVSAHFNTITGNTYNARLSSGQANLQNNWWGVNTGPANATLIGSPVTTPYLKGVVSAGAAQALDTANLTVRSTVGLDVTSNNASLTMGVVGAARYAANPQTVAPTGTPIAYYDVFVQAPSAGQQITIKFYGTVTDNTKVYYGGGLTGAWSLAGTQGVNVNSGYAYVTIDANTLPAITDLDETPFVLSNVVPPPSTPVLTGPIAGAIVAVNTGFSWTAVPVAGVTYDFQVSTSPAFSTFLANVTNLSNNVYGGVALAANTTYFWRVRSMVMPLMSAWTVSTFTTAAPVAPAGAAAATPPPVVNITAPPAPNVTVQAPPPAQVTVQAAPPANVTVNPPAVTVQAPPAANVVVNVPEPVPAIPTSILWVIILIGAVLIIALIVLIVRTRRVA